MGHRFRLTISLLGGLLLPLLLLGASPPNRTFGARDADAGADASSPPTYFASTSPEPPPLREREQYVVDLRWVRGDVYLVAMTKTTFPTPQETPRVMGRFALELYEGKTLVERVRFDFPLLAAPDPGESVKLSQKLSTRIGVTFPATPRGTHFELWDRVTGTRWIVPWPPASIPLAANANADAGSHDAGSHDAGGRDR